MMSTILSSFGTTSRRATAADRGIFSSASIAILLTSVLVLATSSCGGAGSSIVGSTTQAVQSFQAASGNNQVGTAGSVLPTPLTVRALTKSGRGVSGISVQWTFSGGGGSLTPDGTVSKNLTTVTDKQGQSSVYWQLDTIAGDQTATAALSGTSSNPTTNIKFHSHGKAGGPARLVVSPGTDTLAVGESTQFTATVLDRWKNVISGATVSWSSSNDSVVAVSSAGVAKALRSGSATVIATTSAPPTTSPSVSASSTSSISGGASVSVESSTASTTHAATVSVTPASLSFTSLNATAQLSAVARDSTGNTVTNAGFTWKSLAISIATVSTTGLVTAKAFGTTRIIVSTTCCGADTVTATVTQAVPPSFQEDWNYTSTANMQSNPNGWFLADNLTPSPSDAAIELDTGITTPWGGSKALKIQFYAGSCGTEVAAGKNIQFPTSDVPSGTREIWVEIYTKFESQWKTNFGCSGNPDHKWVFYRQNFWGGYGRWDDKIGTYGGNMTAGAISPSGNATGGNGTPVADYIARVPPGTGNPIDTHTWFWDGKWHLVRVHLKAPDPNTYNGVFQVEVDGTMVVDRTGFTIPITSAGGFIGLALGRNLNQYPNQNQAFWFGRIRVWTSDPGWSGEH